MPRRKVIAKREILPDPKYNDKVITKFINNMMVDGKKSVAEGVVYKAFSIMEAKSGSDPVKTFKRALENAKPVVEVKSRRVGGSTYQVPVEVRYERRQALAMRWLISFARKRGE